MQDGGNRYMRMIKRNLWVVVASLTVSWGSGQAQETDVGNLELLEQRRWSIEDNEPRKIGVFSEPTARIMDQDMDLLLSMSPDQLDGFVETHRRTMYEIWRSLHRTVENLLLQNQQELAVQILLRLVGEEEREYRLPEGGRKPGSDAEQVDRLRNQAYEYALLFVITGNEDYAHRAKEILLEFARVFPVWNFYTSEGRAYSQDSTRYRGMWRAQGLLGRWYPLDMGVGLTLLRAYDTLRPLFTEEERTQIENNLFAHHKRSTDLFIGSWRDAVFEGEISGYWRIYHNLSVYQWEALIRYAQVLQRPEWIHEVVRHWSEMMRYGYMPDGFFHELTIDYHRQITSGVLGNIPTMLAGYSDPEGYRDPVSGERFDHLDFSRWEPLMSVIREASRVLVLPDGTLLNTNDAGPARAQAPEGHLQYGGLPGLLGASGLAKLGFGQMSVHLLYGGTYGHDHRNGLDLFWYAGGREVFGGTGYRPLRDSGNTREWNTMTASHNTVMVDGKEHYHNREILRIPQANTSFTSQPPQNKGKLPVEVTLPVGAQYRNQGDLLLWDGEGEQVQAMEVAQEKVYPALASMFRRTVVFVPLSEEEGYLVDIFRVHGGKQHEFFLRGGLDQGYTLSYDVETEGYKEILYKYLQIEKKTEFDLDHNPGRTLRATVAYQDGLRVISHFPALRGMGEGQWTLLQGIAPAIRRMGTADYSLIRHAVAENKNNKGLETVFVRVNEVTSGKERIDKIRAHVDHGKVFIQIQRGEVTDYVLSGVEERSPFHYGDWKFEGRLAWVTVDQNQEISGKVFAGGELRYGESVLPGNLPVYAKVSATGSRFQGHERDYVELELPSEKPLKQTPRLVLLKLGDVFSYAVPVTDMEQNGQQLRLFLQYSPGFEIGTDAVYMNFWPGWRVVGQANAELQF